MAKYWVGGTGSWSDNTNHWSDSSGGAAGADLPASTDNVIIDSNSGFGSGGTLTFDGGDGGQPCNDFTCTSGHTFTISGPVSNSLDLYGSLTLEAGITWSVRWLDVDAVTSETITTAGVTLERIYVNGIGGTITLQDTLNFTGQFYHDNGTVDANDQTVNYGTVFVTSGTGFNPTLTMGSGTWTGKQFEVDENNSVLVTLNSETSKIVFDSSVNFYMKGKTFYDVEWQDDGAFVAEGGTMNTLTLNPGSTYTFEATKTYTLNGDLVINGTLGNVITIISDSAGSAFTFAKSSGQVSGDYLSIKDSTASGGAVFYAGDNSTDVSGNSGWVFNAPTQRILISQARVNVSSRTLIGSTRVNVSSRVVVA